MFGFKARYDMTMSKNAAKKLQAMADKRGLTRGEVIQRALALYCYIDDQRRADPGCKIIVKSAEGHEKEIINT